MKDEDVITSKRMISDGTSSSADVEKKKKKKKRIDEQPNGPGEIGVSTSCATALPKADVDISIS